MGRTGRSNEPYVKPVTHIELSEKNVKLRFVAFILFLVIGVGALVYAAVMFFSQATGWRTIEAGAIRGHVYDREIVFEYNVTSSAEYKSLQSLYVSLLDRAAPLFDADNGYDGINNVYYINRHPNEQIVIDELLYSALEEIESYGFRTIYTGPFYEEYRGLFFSITDEEAVGFDPNENEYVKERADRIAAFASDENSVSLKLLGSNTVTLYVSEEYEAYVKEIGSSSYIDLWLIKNAFIIDYCADIITGAGYKGGRIQSYDGYLRNFDPGTEYSYNIYDFANGGGYVTAEMVYDGVISAVNLRTFELDNLDRLRIYVYKDGRRRTDYLDVNTCLDRTFLPCLTVYSYGKKCHEVGLKALISYISDTDTLGYIERAAGFEYIYSQNLQISHSEKDVKIKSYTN